MDEKEIEELIKIARSKRKEPIKDSGLNDVRSFIIHFNIVKGPKAVLMDHIYNKYREFSKDPIGPNKFSKYFGQYFEKGRTYSVYFRIDPASIGLPADYTITEDTNTRLRKNKRAKKAKENQDPS